MALTYGRHDWKRFAEDLAARPLRGHVSLGWVQRQNQASAELLANLWATLAAEDVVSPPSVHALVHARDWYEARAICPDPKEYSSDALQTSASILGSLRAAIGYLDPEGAL